MKEVKHSAFCRQADIQSLGVTECSSSVRERERDRVSETERERDRVSETVRERERDGGD